MPVTECAVKDVQWRIIHATMLLMHDVQEVVFKLHADRVPIIVCAHFQSHVRYSLQQGLRAPMLMSWPVINEALNDHWPFGPLIQVYKGLDCEISRVYSWDLVG